MLPLRMKFAKDHVHLRNSRNYPSKLYRQNRPHYEITLESCMEKINHKQKVTLWDYRNKMKYNHKITISNIAQSESHPSISHHLLREHQTWHIRDTYIVLYIKSTWQFLSTKRTRYHFRGADSRTNLRSCSSR